MATLYAARPTATAANIEQEEREKMIHIRFTSTKLFGATLACLLITQQCCGGYDPTIHPKYVEVTNNTTEKRTVYWIGNGCARVENWHDYVCGVAVINPGNSKTYQYGVDNGTIHATSITVDATTNQSEVDNTPVPTNPMERSAQITKCSITYKSYPVVGNMTTLSCTPPTDCTENTPPCTQSPGIN